MLRRRFSISPPNTCATRHKATGLASGSKRKSTLLVRCLVSTNWLFQNLQNPPRPSGAYIYVCVCVCVWVNIYQPVRTGQILNSEFSFSQTSAMCYADAFFLSIYICVCVCVCVCLSKYLPTRSNRSDFEFRVFLLPDWLPNKGQRTYFA